MTETPESQKADTNRDKRFHQLVAVARQGDECAIADLWREYGFRFEEGTE